MNRRKKDECVQCGKHTATTDCDHCGKRACRECVSLIAHTNGDLDIKHTNCVRKRRSKNV